MSAPPCRCKQSCVKNPSLTIYQAPALSQATTILVSFLMRIDPASQKLPHACELHQTPKKDHGCRLDLTPLNTMSPAEGVPKVPNRKIWEDVLSVMRIRTFQIIVLQACPAPGVCSSRFNNAPPHVPLCSMFPTRDCLCCRSTN